MKYCNLIIKGIILSVIIIACSSPDNKQKITAKQPVDYVDVFIGTLDHGHTFPGATVPFGSVQLTPVNGTEAWDWCSGYHYSDSVIYGFSHHALSGTGIGDLCDILVTPTIKPIDLSKIDIKAKKQSYFSSKFSHNNESAKPGYYSVVLDEGNIKSELSVTNRIGFHRYTFPKSDKSSIVFDLGFHINWDTPVKTHVKVVSDNKIVGYRLSTGWANDQRVYFAAEFSKPFKKHTIIDKKENINGNEATGDRTKVALTFNTKKDEKVLLKVAVSSVDIDGALKNLASDNNKFDFNKVRNLASNNWNKELDKIHIETDSEDDKTIFYTAQYHAYIAPFLFSDVDGRYKGNNGKIEKAEGYNRYTLFSLWDTFRATHPLFTITQPERVNDMIKSMLAQYKETGLLPVWDLMCNETNCMIGYNALPVVADAITKNIGDFDRELAFEAMKSNTQGKIMGLPYWRDLGFIPADKELESVSKSLEFAYGDWTLAHTAKFLGKAKEEKEYLKRASQYRKYFDKSVGFMRGVNADGKFVKNFHPKQSEHRKDNYCEGNAWQWTWYVPHDVNGLVKLFGGVENFDKKLDGLFNESSEIVGSHTSSDITGLIGQYAHGNEPCHHVAYLYSYIGKPWKTQEKVTEILRTQYTIKKNGLCGNDDCGQMSAWYVMNSLGFYPANPANGLYVFGTPSFKKTTLNLDNGKKFIIEAENKTKENIYIQSVSLNGKEYNKTYISHSDIVKGGALKFVMGNKPNKNWGTNPESFPPSMTKM